MNDNIRQFFFYSINTFFKSVCALCRCTVILSHMKMYNSCSRIISRLCFSYNLFHCIRYIRVLLFCNLCTTYTCRNNKFIHNIFSIYCFFVCLLIPRRFRLLCIPLQALPIHHMPNHLYLFSV